MKKQTTREMSNRVYIWKPFLGPNTAAELGTVIVNYFLNWEIKYYPGTKSNVQSEM